MARVQISLENSREIVSGFAGRDLKPNRHRRLTDSQAPNRDKYIGIEILFIFFYT